MRSDPGGQVPLRPWTAFEFKTPRPIKRHSNQIVPVVDPHVDPHVDPPTLEAVVGDGQSVDQVVPKWTKRDSDSSDDDDGDAEKKEPPKRKADKIAKHGLDASGEDGDPEHVESPKDKKRWAGQQGGTRAPMYAPSRPAHDWCKPQH